ncbi:hypothetical protein THAPSDRAFT_269773 [Thalassiosira pseudonana CCMP1335]|uniref:N-acetylgalactosaminide beta-1,3-galactosyltransferase n=1 Tax=Thalassiosira pseudonana TaxID=35128 RepID=B8CCI7_THAPS|nr:hypothetical protein THAPSDRAFT_269773 [Thalassiosira pseudonana CCMP1335]EED88781.1 hypothetical protein THAPSDRAFT_269773 [Thalassiosira pseudonana CCMP1335]
MPSITLDMKRLEVILSMNATDITYVDASGNHTTHPHMGGKDEHGRWGYVHDETALKRTQPTFEIRDDDDRANLCKSGGTILKRVRLLCLVYTIEQNHNRIPAIRETWGQKCDGFMVVSNKTDMILGTVNIPHEGLESYDNIYQKVRSIWAYIYDNYYDVYDYFHIGGDDLYLIVENLRHYLESEEIQLASNGGQFLPNGYENKLYLGGGSGYTLNKAALKSLVVHGFPSCFPHEKTSAEDMMVSKCFEKIGIFPYDSKDETGAERYLQLAPGDQCTLAPGEYGKDNKLWWYHKFNEHDKEVKFGTDHCSANAVNFHYVNSDLMRRIHALLYRYCER